MAGKLKIMYYTYVLLCTDTKHGRQKFYIGVTENFQKRLQKHKSNDIKTTKSFDKKEPIYYEACLNKTDARKREIQLKTGFGRGYINRRLENFLNKRD